MKWFKHDTDMLLDLKIVNLIEKFGVSGYAVWNATLEMVGREGKGGRIEAKLRWQEGIASSIRWTAQGKTMVDIYNIFTHMAELNLICPKSFKYGNLYIPKFTKRADDYTLRKLRTQSEESTGNVLLDKKRIDKTRIDKIRDCYILAKGHKKENYLPDDFGRTARAIITLINKASGKDELVLKAIQWAAKKSWCDWTLETLIKKWVDFLKDDQIRDEYPEELRKYVKTGG